MVKNRVEVASARVKNGWIRNEDMWVLIREGKSHNIAIAYAPPWPPGDRKAKGQFSIFKGSKIIGFSRTLGAAKRRAEKIKTPRTPFK